MKSEDKRLLRALAGEALDPPPAWMMRQAGRYLPEYRQTREKAGSFLELCYSPELAAEVTLQPLRRYDFDAAILFADILLVPQALGADLWFVTGEGPRLSTIASSADLQRLKPVDAIHDTLGPVYETLRILRESLPEETALIGFAGAPWTVATYMIAGQGTKDQAPARQLMYSDPKTFDALMNLITDATAQYLCRQIEAGAEVIKLFDSWAGALPGALFDKYATAPAKRILDIVRARYPGVPAIGFPRQAGEKLLDFVDATGVAGCAIDTSVRPEWAARELSPRTCVQGNLDPALLVTGGDMLLKSVDNLKNAFAGQPYIFNLGHGITPDADPANVNLMLKALRGR
ncbi:uroporphyrinogen decarboxylase [Algicella marina]|uniref:Uroporphyrinogen decarboxylase n=1 Tax=Algicella marina TaxID=2683284 RepID=A0A6P1T7B1_9RHOB|nr:uroporphyrinogen decarboxylase [Algicella marina]QHQ36462.1 uroporphyrinogen decarboxylase [Algicella marina]